MTHEIPMKQFLAEEAIRLRVDPSTIHRRLTAGEYPGVKVRRVNKRVAFVTPNQKSAANQRSDL